MVTITTPLLLTLVTRKLQLPPPLPLPPLPRLRLLRRSVVGGSAAAQPIFLQSTGLGADLAVRDASCRFFVRR